MARTKSAPPEQGVLFGPVPVEQVGKVTAPPAAGARYAHYSGRTRMQCHDCVIYLHEHGGNGPAVRSARVRRTAGRNELFLCTEHAELRREADGVPPVKEARRGRRR